MTQFQTFEEQRWAKGDQTMQFRHRVTLSLIPEGARILDIGCGDGLLLQQVQKEKSVTGAGIDLSTIAIEKAKQKTFNLDLRCLDLITQKIPYDDNSFDVLIALDVLEHLLIPENLLLEMRRVNKKSVIVGVSNFSSLPARLQCMLGKVPENNKSNKGHMYWFNWQELNNMIEKTKLSIKDIRTNYQLMHLPVFGSILGVLARFMPNIFALSFVLSLEKKYE